MEKCCWKLQKTNLGQEALVNPATLLLVKVEREGKGKVFELVEKEKEDK